MGRPSAEHPPGSWAAPERSWAAPERAPPAANGCKDKRNHIGLAPESGASALLIMLTKMVITIVEVMVRMIKGGDGDDAGDGDVDGDGDDGDDTDDDGD